MANSPITPGQLELLADMLKPQLGMVTTRVRRTNFYYWVFAATCRLQARPAKAGYSVEERDIAGHRSLFVN